MIRRRILVDSLLKNKSSRRLTRFISTTRKAESDEDYGLADELDAKIKRKSSGDEFFSCGFRIYI